MKSATALEMEGKLLAATERRGARIASWDRIKALITDPSPQGLAMIDQLHTGGLLATRLLARLAQVKPGDKVLEVGCGAGGPARVLAGEKGAVVTGIDITPGLIDLARRLSEVADISVRFETADALDLPFEEATFDVVWTQHAAAAIADKTRFYAEMRRVLKPGGRLAMHDMMQGTTQGTLHMPIPTTDTEDVTFLMRPERLTELLSTIGLRKVIWRDQTAATIDWFKMLPPAGSFSIQLIKGDRFPEMVENLKRNLQEGLVEISMGIFEAI